MFDLNTGREKNNGIAVCNRWKINNSDNNKSTEKKQMK